MLAAEERNNSVFKFLSCERREKNKICLKVFVLFVYFSLLHYKNYCRAFFYYFFHR